MQPCRPKQQMQTTPHSSLSLGGKIYQVLFIIFIIYILQNIKTVTNKLTDSMTSKKTSFFLYLIPCPLHETALVNASGGRGATSSLCPS